MIEPIRHFTRVQVMIFVVSTPSVARRSTAFSCNWSPFSVKERLNACPTAFGSIQASGKWTNVAVIRMDFRTTTIPAETNNRRARFFRRWDVGVLPSGPSCVNQLHAYVAGGVVHQVADRTRPIDRALYYSPAFLL